MGALKDIYDIVSEMTSEIKANRLKKRGERSREELEAICLKQEEGITEIQAKLKELQMENEDLVAENARLKAGPRRPQVTGLDPGIQSLY